MFAGPGEVDHHAVDIVLPAALPSSALADQHALGLAACEFENLGGDKIVEQDDIGGLKRPNRLQREILGIPRPCPHQCHPPGFRGRGALSRQGEEVQLRPRVRPLAGRKGAIHEALPEETPLRSRLEALVHRVAKRLCKLRPLLQSTREQGLDAPADRLRENWRRAIRGD